MELPRDPNHITVGGAVSNADNITALPLRVDPVTGYALLNVAGDSISATAATIDKRDQNHKPTMYGISSVDGVTLVPIRTDDNGNILIDLLIN